MAEEGAGTGPKGVVSTVDKPTSMKVQPELYNRFQTLKERFGLKDLKEAQLKALEFLDADRAGPIPVTQEQLQHQQALVNTVEQTAQMVGTVDPIDRLIKMKEKRMLLRAMDDMDRPPSRNEDTMSMRDTLNLSMVQDMMDARKMNTIMMMDMMRGEGKSTNNESTNRLLAEMERNRDASERRIDEVKAIYEQERAEKQKQEAVQQQRSYTDTLMAYMESTRASQNEFMADLTARINIGAAGGKDDMDIATEAAQKVTSYIGSIKAAGLQLGLKESDVEKVVNEEERTTTDKIKGVFDGVGALLDKVSPLFEKAMTGEQAAPPGAVVAPPGGPPAMTAQDMPSGLTQEVLQAAMGSKPQGQNWIYTQDEIEAIMARIPADKELPRLTVMPTPQGNCYLLSNDEKEFLEGLAAQAGAPAAETAAVEKPEVEPGAREWVAPPEEEVTEPGEAPPEEPPSTTPPGEESETAPEIWTAPAGTVTIPEVPGTIKVRTSVSPPEEAASEEHHPEAVPGRPLASEVEKPLEEPEAPPAPEMHTCARCGETKPMPITPYCDDCWVLENAEAAEIAEEVLEEDKRAFGNSCRWCGKKCKSRGGRSSHENSCTENPANNPLVCRWCGKKCKSSAGRSSHEKSCPENPANKENE